MKTNKGREFTYGDFIEEYEDDVFISEKDIHVVALAGGFYSKKPETPEEEKQQALYYFCFYWI